MFASLHKCGHTLRGRAGLRMAKVIRIAQLAAVVSTGGLSIALVVLASSGDQSTLTMGIAAAHQQPPPAAGQAAAQPAVPAAIRPANPAAAQPPVPATVRPANPVAAQPAVQQSQPAVPANPVAAQPMVQQSQPAASAGRGVNPPSLPTLPTLPRDPPPTHARPPTNTPTRTATPTSTPVARASMTPTAQVTPTVTPTSSSVSINGVPLCDGQNGRPAHDPTKWHPLLVKNANGSVVCTYGHEHGMNPNSVNDIFGALPLAQSISYPWATISSNGVAENGPDYKHRVYKWLVGRDVGSCGITAFRLQAHDDGNLGAINRFHSFWVQLQLTDCSTGQQGMVYFGGHEDYAHLHAGDQVVSLPGDPPPGCPLMNDARGEGKLGGPEQSNSVWYGSNNRGSPQCDDYFGETPHLSLQLNIGTDSWGPVDPNNPAAFNFYPNREVHRGTLVGSDDLGLTLSTEWPTDASGRVNLTGFLNRHGLRVSDCAPQGMDCIPVRISNVRPGGYAADIEGKAVVYDGDVPGPNGQGGFYVQTPSQDK